MAPDDEQQRAAAAILRELRLVHPRVYVDHTGPLTWSQRAWAAVLWAEPAALCHVSMARRPSTDDPIHVAVSQERRLRAVPAGVVVHRLRGLAGHLGPSADPPRLIRADNALLLAGEAETAYDIISVLAEAVAQGATADQLARALERFPRIRPTRWSSSSTAG